MSSDEIITFKDSIPIHIVEPNGGHCVYYPSNPFFRKTRSFENLGISSG